MISPRTRLGWPTAVLLFLVVLIVQVSGLPNGSPTREAGGSHKGEMSTRPSHGLSVGSHPEITIESDSESPYQLLGKSASSTSKDRLVVSKKDKLFVNPNGP